MAAFWFTLAVFESSLAAAAVAGAAVSVPIIIHLLNRKRFKVVSWAAMRFLLAAQRKNSRRMRLEQLVLLVVRCLVLLLLIMAMCSVTGWAESIWRWLMPDAVAQGPSSSQRTHKILVIDGSVSMAVKVGDGTAFTRAIALAGQVVKESPRGDCFSVVLLADPPRRIVAEPSEDGRKVAAEIEALRLPHGNADLAACLNTVEGVLQSSPGKFPAKEVYFFTDLQKSTWISGQQFNLPARLRTASTILVDIGVENPGNIALTNLALADDVAIVGRKSTIVATLHNYSNETKKNVGVKLLTGRGRLAANDPPFQLLPDDDQKKTLDIERNQDRIVSFSYDFKKPGDYVVQVQVGEDNLPPDDARGMVLTVKDNLPVLLVNGKSFGDPFDQSAEWLRLALNPFNKREEGTSIVKPTMINAAHFADENQGDLGPYDCVYLCDVPSLGLAEKRRLEGHLRRGGGVIFALGGQVQAGDYNRVLFSEGSWLLPAPLVNSQGAGSTHQYQFTLEPDSDRGPPLKAFQGENDRATLLATRFTRFWQTGPSPTGVRPRRVLSFSPRVIPGKENEARTAKLPLDGPAILEWKPPFRKDEGGRMKDEKERLPSSLILPPSSFVRGRVVMITTGLNSDWGNWPASPSYPALMHELVYFAAAGRLQEQSIEVGQELDLYLAGALGVEATIDPPDHREEKAQTQNLDDGSVLRLLNTGQSGVYRVVLGAHPREYLFAVNVPALTPSGQGSESDLTRTSGEELRKAYPDWELQVVSELQQIKRVSQGSTPGERAYHPFGTVIAGWLLIAVLTLVLAEVVLAFVFGHYSSNATESAGTSGAPAGGEPSGAGLRRVAVFWVRVLTAMPWVLLIFGVLLAGVMIQEAVTGDLFDFLGDGPRRVLEQWAGVPAPPVGEGRHWRLEYPHTVVDRRMDPWLAVGVLLMGAILVWAIYRREGLKPKTAERVTLMGLRLGIVLLLLGVLLPQLVLHFERQGWPDVVLLIDDSESMSGKDRYAEADVAESANNLALQEAGRLAADKRVLAQKKEEQAQDREEAAQKRTPDDPERARLLIEAKLLQEQARGLDADADTLDKARDGSEVQRLHLLQGLTTRTEMRWLSELASQRKVKIHIYHCSTRAAKLTQVTATDDLAGAGDAIKSLTASPSNDSSQLGSAVRQVINDFRGSSLAAIIMMTDGVTTEGEDLPKVSKYAAGMGVPLYFVGVGDAHEIRDIYLHDLQAPDSVYIKDRLHFDLKITGKGYKNVKADVKLWEKGKPKVPGNELDKKTVDLVDGKTVELTLKHQPTEPGEKVYEIETPVREDEDEKDNNRLEKAVSVRETKLIKILYVEGYRRYEYHFLKTLLERESNRVKGNKTMDLKVLLMDADKGYALSDRCALSEFPTRKELDEFDVVILGDVDPQANPQMEGHLKDLAEFVKERGGGLLMIAGERHSPQAYKNSPLRDVMAVEVVGNEKEGSDLLRQDGYRLALTPPGRVHPIFRSARAKDDKENEAIWGQLREMYWWADGYVPKRAAEVLAVHPSVKRADRKGAGKDDQDGPILDKHPLVVQQFVGSGRSMFFGFGETWRWGHREHQADYNNFWIQTVRYLARSRLGRIDLKLDRQTPYRRGERIRVTVRFPDDAPPPGKDTEVKVVVERKVPGKEGLREIRTIQLDRAEGSRTAFEGGINETPEGEYTFWLSVPVLPDPKPKAECKVVLPPGEMYGLRMNQPGMEEAARESRGKFYTLATADQLLQDLQVGNRVTVSSSGRPWRIWNTPIFFVVALLLLSTEWLLRKRLNLL